MREVEGKSSNTNNSFASRLAIQRRVISALMIREAMTRYGHENLGFFWIMGEPLLLTCGVMIMWSLAGGTHNNEIGVVPFIISGYSMLTLWRHCVFRSIRAMRNNIGLLFHRNIRYLDILIARIVLESLAGLAAFFIAYLPLNLLGYLDTMDDPLLLLGAWALMSWFGFGVGLILAALTELFEPLEQFVAPIMYITLPVTGVFSMVNWLPDTVRSLMLWSPLVHAFEMFRCGLFGSKIATEWSASYLAICATTLTALGLTLIREAQKHVRME